VAGRRRRGCWPTLWHYPVFYVAGPLWKLEAHPTAALLAWLVTFALAAASFR